MKLFVANCSQQVQIINCRAPEAVKPWVFTIDIGQQKQIGGDLSQPQIDAIVEQMSVYGLLNAADINRARGVVPYIYSIDRSIKSETILKVVYHNRGVMSLTGKERREQAAVATNNALDGLRETPDDATVKVLEMSVEEESSGSFAGAEGEVPIKQGVRVVNNDQAKTPRQSSRKRN